MCQTPASCPTLLPLPRLAAKHLQRLPLQFFSSLIDELTRRCLTCIPHFNTCQPNFLIPPLLQVTKLIMKLPRKQANASHMNASSACASLQRFTRSAWRSTSPFSFLPPLITSLETSRGHDARGLLQAHVGGPTWTAYAWEPKFISPSALSGGGR